MIATGDSTSSVLHMWRTMVSRVRPLHESEKSRGDALSSTLVSVMSLIEGLEISLAWQFGDSVCVVRAEANDNPDSCIQLL